MISTASMSSLSLKFVAVSFGILFRREPRKKRQGQRRSVAERFGLLKRVEGIGILRYAQDDSKN